MGLFDDTSDSVPRDSGSECNASEPAPVTCSSTQVSSSSRAVAINSITGKFSNIEHKYHIRERIIGTGHHATVKECIDFTKGQRYAVKSIRKSDPAVKHTHLQREVKLLKEMSHQNVLELKDVYEDAEYLHLVTDLYEGGELFERVKERVKSSDISCFAEGEAAPILRQVLNALSYLHRHGIVHRDIKPENIVFETMEEDSSIKIVDFGLARKHYRDSFEPYMTSVVGTPYYLAPEVLQQKYDKSCDLWSVGVIAFLLLGGYMPFNGKNNQEVGSAIKRGKCHFHPKYWNGVSKEGKDFVSQLLRANPKMRMTVEQALSHPWMARHSGSTVKGGGCQGSTCVEVEPKRVRRRDSVLSFIGIKQRKVRLSLFGS